MKRPRHKFLVFIATATAVAGCASSGIEVRPIVEINGDRVDGNVSGDHKRGLAYMQAGRLGRALQEFRQALRENPNSIETLNAVAVAYDLMERFEMAHHYYERALALDPNSLQTLNNLGRSYLAQGNVQLASRYLGRARTIDSSAPQLQDNLERLVALEYSGQRPSTQSANASAIVAGRVKNSWIERTTAIEQTFVTTPPRQAVEALQALDVSPSTVSFKADIGQIRSEPIESVGSAKSRSLNRSPEHRARSRPSPRDAFKKHIPSKPVQARVDVSDAESASLRASAEEPVLPTVADPEPDTKRKQSNAIHAAFVAAAPHTVFVRHSPRSIDHMLAQSELASDTPVTKTPHENPSMSKPLEVATASFQNSRSEAKETTIIFSENNGNALVLEMHRTNYPEREKIKAPKPREIAPPIKQYHRQARSDIDSDNGLSTRFLNTCSLKSIRSRMSSTAPRFRREKTSHYSATTDELPSNVATTKPTAMALMEVLNGVGRARMAARFGHYLSSQGFCMTKLRDAEMFGQTISKIYYSSGFENQATQVIEALPGNIAMEKNDNMTGNIRLVLGSDLLNFDLILEKGI